MKNKIIVILGQTATGKSDFAVEVALRLGSTPLTTGRSGQAQKNSEIISADSRQVYKGMDLGTGKITKKEMQKVRHYLLDIVSPKKIFSVSDFQKIALKKINNISSSGKIPIICGGTGFYIDSIVNGTIFPEVPPNKKLRDQLTTKETAVLYNVLKKLDPKRALNIDPKNKVRLIRAIEIAKALGQVPTLSLSTNSAMAEFVANYNFDVLKIGLSLPPEILKERIKTRLISRIKKGMIKEVENLHDNGLSWKRMDQLGLEYRYVSLFLQGKLNKKEMMEKLNTEIWHFAKRQMTWFKRDKNIIWIDPRKKSDRDKSFKKIKEFLK